MVRTSDEKRVPRKYRPDIDGLRAIAVLFVVGFHAFPTLFPGGFCGVDVFFVISGYLITGILIEQNERGKIQFGDFYRRRVRRIFPALIAVLCASLAIGWFLLFDGEYSALLLEVVNGGTFLSNFLSWQLAGYFDKAAETKPLLHLWSLAIEEQFYLVWPLFIAAAGRARKDPARLILTVGALSFFINLAHVYNGSHAAYYSPLARFWELMVGGYLSIGAEGKRSQRGDGYGLIGMALLLCGFFVVDSTKAFPGLWALLPTLGTSFILVAGPHAFVNRLLLSNPILVWFGLISFPLYLWHWPLLSFATILAGQQPSVAVRACVLALSLALAALTYYAVEQPIRKKSVDSPWIAVLLVSLLLVTGVGGYLRHARVKSRSVTRQANLLLESREDGRAEGNLVPGCGTSDPSAEKFFGVCARDKRGTPSVALIGDSKAESLVGGLVRNSDPSSRILIIGGQSQDGGRPVPILSELPQYRSYQKSMELAIETVLHNPNLKVVILTAGVRSLFLLPNDHSLEGLSGNSNFEAAVAGLERAVSKLLQSGRRIVLTVDNPTLPDPLNCLPRTTSSEFLNELFQTRERPNCRLSYARHMELSQTYFSLLQRVKAAYPRHVFLFDGTDLLCDIKQNICPIQRDGRLLYDYTDHISDYASTLLGARLMPQVREWIHAGPVPP